MMAVALFVFGGCTGNLMPDRSTTELSLDECFGANCPGQGAIDVEVVVESDCPPGHACKTLPLPKEPFIEMVELHVDGEHCGAGDCGAVPHALRTEGWNVGTWRMIAPKLPGLIPPEPIVIELEEHEVEHVTLVYSEADH